MSQKHIVIDARIRPASTGRPVDRLLEYLPKLDTSNHYTVLVKPDDPWTTTAKNISVVKCAFRMYSFNPLNQLRYAWQLYGLKPDLVYFTLTGQQPLGYFGRQITLTHDLTMYEFVRAGRLPMWAHRLRMVGYRLLMWVGHRKAKHIIVPSDYVKRGLSEFHRFTARKITRVYESSEPPIAGPATPLAGVGKQFILHVGSPFPHKNIERLIEAFELLHARNPDLQLVLAGKKEYFFEQLQHQIDASPAKHNILVPGFVNDGELKWLYQNTLCYALPSLSEGFGLPGLEAMAHGCPLASSNATCLPEVYGDAALYFDPSDVADMARVIDSIMSNKTIAAGLVKKGKAQLQHYSWQTMTKQMHDIMMMYVK